MPTLPAAVGIATLLLALGPPGARTGGPASPSVASAQAPAEPLPHPTPAERSDYQAYAPPGEVVSYLDRLSREVDGLEVGVLPGSRVPVARVASTGAESPLRVLVVAAQHGTERAGIEVALRVVRDLVAGRLAKLRSRLEVRVVPMANPEGVENRRRLSPDGIDLDRDHVRLEAPETRALWEEYTAWRPHLVLDLHEIGPSEYPLQVGVPTHPNAPGARRLARYYLLPHVANELARADVPFQEYAASWVDGETAERAARPVRDTAAGGETHWFTPPALDPAYARNAFALAGSAAFYIATASSRDIIGFRDRTERLYLAVSALLKAAAVVSSEVAATYESAARTPKDSLAVRARYVETGPGASQPWIFVNERGQREQGRLRPWRSRVSVERRLPAPAGWWVEADRRGLIAALRGHGFETRDSAPERRAAAPAAMAYAGCPDDADPVAAEPPADALWVPADQPGGRLLFTLIEPGSRGGWFRSGDGTPTAECGADGRYPVYRASP
ncbi:MAG: M14 family zinc carboxypeptidase [Gemmatimonadota bacterium]